MRKCLLLALFFSFRFFCIADAILWQVDEGLPVYDENENPVEIKYNAARILVSPSGDGTDYVICSALYFNEDTWGYTDEYPDGIGIVSEVWGNPNGYYEILDEPASTGEMWSKVPDGLDKSTAKFRIELGDCSYNEETYEVTWLGTKAQGDPVSYRYLETIYSMGHGGVEFDNVFHMWDGAPYHVFHAVPEPSSCLLVVFGASLLLLRRKCA